MTIRTLKLGLAKWHKKSFDYERLVPEDDADHAPLRASSSPPIRREWRALLPDERKQFTDAVTCLSKVTSLWGLNGTLYDDFAILHEQIGSIYWDWTMDWMNLAGSSIWHNETGFGGDGDPSGPIVVGEGRCVIDGPFAQLRPVRYNHKYLKHCLSRGFRDTDPVGRPLGPWFGPESIGKLLRMPTYQEFEWEMENRLHNRMHRAVSGDFLSLAAANDPVFYLHHAQIDHLWWRWQQQDRAKRLYEYGGKQTSTSTKVEASVVDTLHYGGFIEDIPISKVMDTENGFLCYRY
ncbi:Tyrosinase 4 [Colletotrichum chlorophyti]|uniref:Tyrosinase 4 n=1 Tax=Colletotrichum chlorophyti TaxID=708187 RepID=A0A1Q8RQN6_9PEZI|nr:Tyrosinase 4 [Colletotrichum chlorophyti]